MRIGVLGGGQLGRMLALAGIPLGLEFVFYDPNPQACAHGLGQLYAGDFADTHKLDAFAAQVDVITLEFENIPITTLEYLAQRVPVFPNPRAVRIAQDRYEEKALFSTLGIPTPRYFNIENAQQLRHAASHDEGEFIVKTRRFGYDGKGQARMDEADQAEAIWSTLGGVPLIAEQRMRFTREVSLIAVRNAHNALRFYPLAENVHENGILIRSQVSTGDPQQSIAELYATRIMQELDYVGVLAFEFFDCAGELVANEIAPRVHNSGHWSIEGAMTSQFENHLRAMLDLPLGETAVRGQCLMYNLIGEIPSRAALLAIPGASLHDYGKSPRPGRKVGHITLYNPTRDAVRQLETLLHTRPVDASRPAAASP